MNLPDKLVWVDLETTGLNPAKDRILEVAIVVTNNRLEELGHFVSVVKQDVSGEFCMVPFVREMHLKNGLLDAVEQPQTRGLEEVEQEAIDFLVRMGVEKGGPICGSSPHFDMRFLRAPTNAHCDDDEQDCGVGMYQLAHWFNHRVFDVSTLKLAAMLTPRYCGLDEVEGGDVAHRALPDIRGSIAVAKRFLFGDAS